MAGVTVLVAGATWSVTQAAAGLGAVAAMLAGSLAFVAVTAAAGLLGGLVPRGDADWLAGALPAAVRPALVLVGGLEWSRSRRLPAGVG